MGGDKTVIIADPNRDTGESPGVHKTGSDEEAVKHTLLVNAVRGPYVLDFAATDKMAKTSKENNANSGVYFGHFDSTGPGRCNTNASFVDVKVHATH